MVIPKKFSLSILLAFLLAGCAQREISYEDARKLFQVGMSPAEVEKAYGKPQFQNELGDFVLWNYPPMEPVSAPAKGVKELRGFQIEFRDNKTTKIAPTWSIEKPSEGGAKMTDVK